MRNTMSAGVASEPARRAAIYTRISKDKHGDELGVARQVKLCREVVAQQGWSLAGTYVDNNLSAFKRKRRPEFDRLVDDIRAGLVTAIAVYNPDRLSRDDLRGLEDLIDLLNGYDVRVQSVRSGEFDLTTAHGRAQARMAGVWARLESEKASERLMDKHNELAAAGKPNGGPRLYGYQRVGAKHTGGEDTRALVPDPDEAPIVAEVIERVGAGETLTRIAEDLAARGVRTTRGATWTLANVRRMVLNGRYAGRRIHKGKDVGPGDWPALVDEADWRRAVAVLTAPERPKRRSARRYLLAGGLLRCGRPGCGVSMIAKQNHRPGGSVPAYTCPPKRPQPGAQPGCGTLSVVAEPLERLIADAVIARVESPAYARQLRRAKRGDPKAKADAAAVEREQEELVVAFEQAAITVAEWTRAKAALAGRLADAQARMTTDTAAAAVGRFAGQEGALAAWWNDPDTTLDRKQAVVRAVVDHIVVAPADRRGPKVFNPARVTISWRS